MNEWKARRKQINIHSILACSDVPTPRHLAVTAHLRVSSPEKNQKIGAKNSTPQ